MPNPFFGYKTNATRHRPWTACNVLKRLRAAAFLFTDVFQSLIDTYRDQLVSLAALVHTDHMKEDLYAMITGPSFSSLGPGWLLGKSLRENPQGCFRDWHKKP
jgi:hypothetical protein